MYCTPPFSAPTFLGNYDIKMSFIKWYKLTVYVDMKDWNCYGYIEILAAFFHMKIKTSAIFFTVDFNTHSYRVRCVIAVALNFISIVPQDFSKRKRIPDVQIQNVVFYGHMRYLQRVQVMSSQFSFIFVMGTWNIFFICPTSGPGFPMSYVMGFLYRFWLPLWYLQTLQWFELKGDLFV